MGAATSDDAGVYRLNRRQALVQTVDFFTPIVDDPFVYGQIAATNSLSDVYAMGGRPLTALNILGMPGETVPPKVIREILRGGQDKVSEAGCALLGGHSIKNPEPIYGLAVTGIVDPKRMITNARGRPGDLLVLTKPLGTGIITTAIKRGSAQKSSVRLAVESMTKLNIPGAILAEKGLVKAGTDVTGFGLLGHLKSLCLASGVNAKIYARKLPVLSREVFGLIASGCVPGGTKENLRYAEKNVLWKNVAPDMRYLLADAQTSGGLLLCVHPKQLSRVQDILRQHNCLSNEVIGELTETNSTRKLMEVEG